MTTTIEPAAYNLHKLVFALDRIADQLVQAKFDITYKRVLCLIMLNMQKPMTQHQLASTLGHTDPAVSMMVAELARDSYVAVFVSPDHGRKRIVKLTAQGRKLATAAQQYLDKSFSQLMMAADIDEYAYNRQTVKIYKTLVGDNTRGETINDNKSNN